MSKNICFSGGNNRNTILAILAFTMVFFNIGAVSYADESAPVINTITIPSSVRPPADYTPIQSGKKENINIEFPDQTASGTTSWIQNLVSKVSADYTLNNNKILLIQDYLPWYSNANMEMLDSLKIPYDSINSNSLTGTNLNNYKAIIIPSDQPAGFYDIIRQHKARWDAFVEKGGLLVSHCGDHGWQNGDSVGVLPAGVWKVNEYIQPLFMRDISHKLITSEAPWANIADRNPWYFDNWYWSSHGYFLGVPDGAIDVIDANDTAKPTYIDYTYGKGRVLSTMQTLEFGYTYLGKQELLRNEFLIIKNYSRPLLSTSIPDFQNVQVSYGNYAYNNTNIGIPSTPTYVPDAGDPVNIATGDFGYSNTLLQTKGQGLNYDFKIKYSAQVDYEGNLGHNWSHGYNLMVYPGSSGSLIYLDENFSPREFTKVSDGLYENKSLRATLKIENGLSTISFDNGQIYSFNDAGKIAKIADKNGNALTFQYDEEKKLIKTIDTLGKEVSYSYDADAHLQEIVDATGRKVTFSYNADADLTSIKIGTESASRTISFEYITGNTNTKLNHNISKLIDSKTQTYVENTYDENDRVSIQKYGDGTVKYSYTLDPITSRVLKNNVENRNGTKTEYGFDEKGNVLSRKVQTASGIVEFAFQYDVNGRLTKEIKPNGNSVEYSYDEKGRLLSKKEIGETARLTQYTYDSNHDTPTQITAPNGLVIENTLDDKGNTVKSVLDPVGTKLETTYEYTNNGQLTKIVDPRELQTTLEYSNGNISKITKKDSSFLSILSPGIVQSFSYDADGNPTTVTDGNGNQKIITYDAFHQITKTLSPEGITRSFEYDANGKETKQTLLQSDGTPLSVTKGYDILDHLTELHQQITSDSVATTKYSYDGNENVREITYPNGAKKSFVYNEFDAMVKTITGSGQETTYQYDKNGNITRVTDAKGGTQDIQYNLFGEPVKVTDAKGTYTTFAYDTLGNVTGSQVFDGNNTLLSKQEREYDIFSHLTKQTAYSITGNEAFTSTAVYEKGLLVEKKDPKGNSTKLSYDIYGRNVEIIDNLGNKQTFEYDNNGNVISKKLIAKDGKITETKYVYDRDNRLVSSSIIGENIQAIETKYTYNTLNQIVETIDGNGNHTKYTYDGLGNILVKTETVSGEEVKTSYEYDSMGNVTSLTDANGNKTTYEYDPLGRKTKETLVDGSTTTFTYDANNNLASYTDPNGTTVTNTYDTLNRLTKRSIQRGTNVLGVTEENYSYDALGHLIGSTDSDGNTLAFTYDSLGRLVSEAQNGKTIAYGYDANSNLTSLLSPSGKKVGRAYDTGNRLTNISLDGKSIATYSQNSLTLDSLTLANGAKTNYGYDSLLRLKSLTTSSLRAERSNPGQDIINQYTFSYDSNSNILGNGHDTYSYDTLDRLTNAGYEQTQDKKSTSELWNYDPMGNRLSSLTTETKSTGKDKPKTASTSYDINTLNQYIGSNGTKLSYDKNGNIINNSTFKFSYDYRNRLVEVRKVKENELVAKYTYDTLGRRLSRENKEQITKYVYSNNDAIEETTYEREDKKLEIQETKENFYGNSIDDIISIIRTTYDDGKAKEMRQYFYNKDQLGSITAITDQSGKVIEEYRYDAFGKAYIRDGKTDNWREFKESKIGNVRLFTGREYDREIGLYYYRARYYSADLGRFISRDPIGTRDNVNLYTYVGNNPVKFVDAMGREKGILSYQNNIGQCSLMPSSNSVCSNSMFGSHDVTDRLLNIFTNAQSDAHSLSGMDFVDKIQAETGNSIVNGQKVAGSWNLKEQSNLGQYADAEGYVYVSGIRTHVSNLGNILFGFNVQNSILPNSTGEYEAMSIEIDNYHRGDEFNAGYGVFASNRAYWDEYSDKELYKQGYWLASNFDDNRTKNLGLAVLNGNINAGKADMLASQYISIIDAMAMARYSNLIPGSR